MTCDLQKEEAMLLERFRIDGKVALVTGSGRGIGRSTALALAEAGAHVVCSARSVEQIEAVATQIRDMGRESLAVPCDVNERAQLEKLVDATIEQFGGIDILVNNAGGTPPKPALRTSEKMFSQAIHFNVTSAFLLSRFVIPHMQKRGAGSIVNISSALSQYVEPCFVAYGTAKAALNHLTRLLAHEFAPDIRVNAIAVGSVETDALAPFLENQEMRKKMEALTPMGRVGEPEDIAVAALYLASPAASWVTGKIFEIDGGIVASNWPLDLSNVV